MAFWHAVLSVSALISSLLVVPAEQLTCKRVSRCACVMSDGSGTVDLMPSTSMGFDVKDISDKNVGYIYQPCKNLKLGGDCDSSQVVLCKSVVKNDTIVKSVAATADGVSFVVNGAGNVTIVYPGKDNRSTVYVELVCNHQSKTLFRQRSQPNRHGSQSDLYFALEYSGVCLTTNAPVTTIAPVTNIPKKTCSLSDCSFYLEVTIPATAVGTSLIIIILSCLWFRHKDRQFSRYTTL